MTVSHGNDGIRLAYLDDLPAILTLLYACVRDMLANGIDQWDEMYPDAAILREDIALGTLHVLEQDGRICAMIVLNEFQSPEYAQIAWQYAGKVLVVHRLAVDPVFQGQGYATRLMAFAEDLAVSSEYDAIRLDAFTRNPGAMALYTRRQYHNAGVVQFRKGPFLCFEKATTRADGGHLIADRHPIPPAPAASSALPPGRSAWR